MPPRLPLEDFFRKPDRTAVSLSPDGTHLAFLAPWKRRLNVHVRDLATGEERRVTASTERDLFTYYWVDDRRLVYALDQGGDENWRLYAVDRDGSEPVALTPFDDVMCMLLDDLEDVDGEILFTMNHRKKEVFDVYRIDTNSGEMRMVAENPGNVTRWVADHEGRVRIGVASDGVNSNLLYREDEDTEWRTVAEYTFTEDALPVFFTFDNRSVYVTSNVGRDKRALFEYDLATGRETKLIYEHPEVDIQQLSYSRKRKKILATLIDVEKPEFHYFDDEFRELKRVVDDALPESINRLASHSKDEQRFVVHSRSDRQRGSYHLLDAETREVTELFDSTPWLAADEMASMEPVSFEARDGRLIRGYLTTPDGAGPFPTVVHPHGGPWHRDRWEFDPAVQFLANRGFAVLQVNFRGSTGYGRDFKEASFGQWGLAMQDDVTDATKWAIDTGIADADRIAIWGGSYGGYAALSGLTREPDLYACGVSYCGVSNLFTWLEAFPPYWKVFLETVYVMVGHPERDEERLRATSPYFQADRIRVPVMIAQGANDPRVKKQESDQIVAALQARGIEVEYLVKDDEGHGWNNEENVFEFFAALETFLTRHLLR